MPDDELRRRLDVFQELFVEARMCIEDAVDSAESTYFDEEAESAKSAVEEAVTAAGPWAVRFALEPGQALVWPKTPHPGHLPDIIARYLMRRVFALDLCRC